MDRNEEYANPIAASRSWGCFRSRIPSHIVLVAVVAAATLGHISGRYQSAAGGRGEGPHVAPEPPQRHRAAPAGTGDAAAVRSSDPTENAGRPGFGPVNFYNHPDRFTDALASCIEDDRCHVFFFHQGKTGGTTIHKTLFQLFPPKDTQAFFYTVRPVRSVPKRTYCGAKCGAYEVHAEEFEEVVGECTRMRRPDGRHRAVVLVSLREPMRQLLSTIHEHCNRERARAFMGHEFLDACGRCSYEEDADIWDAKTEWVNQRIEEAFRVSLIRMDRVDVLTVEDTDIDRMFGMLQSALPSRNVTVGRRENTQVLSYCSFGLKSPMIKALAPSFALYQNLTRNF